MSTTFIVIILMVWGYILDRKFAQVNESLYEIKKSLDEIKVNTSLVDEIEDEEEDEDDDE